MTHTFITRLTGVGSGPLLAAGLVVAVTVSGAASGATALPGAAAAMPHGTITTVAGGPGGPAHGTSVSIETCGLTAAGRQLYLTTGGPAYLGAFGVTRPAAYRLSQRTGVMTPVVGSGASTNLAGPASIPGPANGLAAAAVNLNNPCGTSADAAGNVLVADGARVYVDAARTGTFYGRPMVAGHVYTLASGFTGFGAVDVQPDRYGNLVITVGGAQPVATPSETDSQVVVLAERTGTFYGKAMTRGKLYVIAGVRNPPNARPRTSQATPAPVRASQVNLGCVIGTVRFDQAGNIVLADPGASGYEGADTCINDPKAQVWVIPRVAGTFYGQHMRVGYIYPIAGGGTRQAPGVPALTAVLQSADAAAVDHNGNVLVADGYPQGTIGGIRVVAVKNGRFYGRSMTAGDIYLIPQLTGKGIQWAGLDTAVAVDSAGNVLAGTVDRVVMLASRTGSFYGRQAVAGKVYQIAGNGQFGYSGEGGPATSAELQSNGIAVNRTGTLSAVVDTYHGTVRVIARASGVYFGHSLGAGDIYTVAGGGHASVPDGVLGTRVRLWDPQSAAFDAHNNLIVADTNITRVRVVAASTGTFYGQHMTAGYVYTIAGTGTVGVSGDGGPARAAKLGSVYGLTTDSAGNVLLIDFVPVPGPGAVVRVRMVAVTTGTYFGQAMTAGDIYTVAGNGTQGFFGDGGPATAAEVSPNGIARDSAGNLVLADNLRVRVVAASTGTFYGRPMTMGDIYTVAGGSTGQADGTPALGARLGASGVALDQAGNLLVAGTYGTSNDPAVWMVAEQPGSYYGKTMQAGDVYLVAHGVAGRGFLDNCPAIRSQFYPAGIAVQPVTGNLLIADSADGRLRSVSR